MRTTIVLDDALVAEAFKHSACRTKKDLLHEALRGLIQQRQRRNLLDLVGHVAFAPRYDHKKHRR